MRSAGGGGGQPNCFYVPCDPNCSCQSPQPCGSGGGHGRKSGGGGNQTKAVHKKPSPFLRKREAGDSKKHSDSQTEEPYPDKGQVGSAVETSEKHSQYEEDPAGVKKVTSQTSQYDINPLTSVGVQSSLGGDDHLDSTSSSGSDLSYTSSAYGEIVTTGIYRRPTRPNAVARPAPPADTATKASDPLHQPPPPAKSTSTTTQLPQQEHQETQMDPANDFSVSSKDNLTERATSPVSKLQNSRPNSSSASAAPAQGPSQTESPLQTNQLQKHSTPASSRPPTGSQEERLQTPDASQTQENSPPEDSNSKAAQHHQMSSTPDSSQQEPSGPNSSKQAQHTEVPPETSVRPSKSSSSDSYLATNRIQKAELGTTPSKQATSVRPASAAVTPGEKHRVDSKSDSKTPNRKPSAQKIGTVSSKPLLSRRQSDMGPGSRSQYPTDSTNTSPTKPKASNTEVSANATAAKSAASFLNSTYSSTSQRLSQSKKNGASSTKEALPPAPNEQNPQGPRKTSSKSGFKIQKRSFRLSRPGSTQAEPVANKQDSQSSSQGVWKTKHSAEYAQRPGSSINPKPFKAQSLSPSPVNPIQPKLSQPTLSTINFKSSDADVSRKPVRKAASETSQKHISKENQQTANTANTAENPALRSGLPAPEKAQPDRPPTSSDTRDHRPGSVTPKTPSGGSLREIIPPPQTPEVSGEPVRTNGSRLDWPSQMGSEGSIQSGISAGTDESDDSHQMRPNSSQPDPETSRKPPASEAKNAGMPSGITKQDDHGDFNGAETPQKPSKTKSITVSSPAVKPGQQPKATTTKKPASSKFTSGRTTESSKIPRKAQPKTVASKEQSSTKNRNQRPQPSASPKRATKSKPESRQKDNRYKSKELSDENQNPKKKQHLRVSMIGETFGKRRASESHLHDLSYCSAFAAAPGCCMPVCHCDMACYYNIFRWC